MKSRKSNCTTPSVGVGISKMLNFYVKVFYVMGKVLSGELFCPWGRSCCPKKQTIFYMQAYMSGSILGIVLFMFLYCRMLWLINRFSMPKSSLAML